MAAVIEFADVTVRKGQAVLLDQVSWTVEEDERWVVLGPNGAGKTTLLQVASAQLHPTSGVAGILEEVLGTVDVFDLRPRIGLTSAALAERVPRHELVRDVVVSASYGVLGRWREQYDGLDHERADDLLVEVGARHLAERTFGTLSEGERKRVQIARALMTDPELLLLDEPAAGLDLGGREDLVSTLSVLALDPDSPATVLVSHHVEEIPPGFTPRTAAAQGRGWWLRGCSTTSSPSATSRRPSGCRSCSRTRTAAGRPGAIRAIARASARSRLGSRHGLAERPRVGCLAHRRRPAGRRRDVQPRPDLDDARRRGDRGRRCRPARRAGGAAGVAGRWRFGRRCSSLVRPSVAAAALRPRAHAGPQQADRTAGRRHPGDDAGCGSAGSRSAARSGRRRRTATPRASLGETVEVLEIRGATAYVDPIPTVRLPPTRIPETP